MGFISTSLSSEEELILHITFGLIIGLLTVLAVFLFRGKGLILISGMMLLTKEERDKFNKKRLGGFTGSFLLLINVLLALMWIDIAWLETSNFWLTWVATGAALVAAVVMIVLWFRLRQWFRNESPSSKEEEKLT